MRELIHHGRHLDLVADQGWEFVERSNASAVVGIIAVTPGNELLLVEQRRIPVGARVIELPAGLVGDEDAGEDVATAASRELIEETGWSPAACTVLARGPSSAGLTSEIVTLVRATALTRVGAGGGVAGEDITVHAVNVGEVGRWLQQRARAGSLIDHKVYAALWWISRGGGE